MSAKVKRSDSARIKSELKRMSENKRNGNVIKSTRVLNILPKRHPLNDITLVKPPNVHSNGKD
jgi:hypothetical protein